MSSRDQSLIFRIYLLPTRLRLSSCLTHELALDFASLLLKVLFPSFRHSLKDIPLFVQTILCVVKDVQSNQRMICKKKRIVANTVVVWATSHVA